MCSSSQIADPLGLTYKYKWADPLGVTKTAVGDPTGVMRKGHAEEKAYNEAWAKYDASQRASSNVTGGGMTGETIRTPRRNPGGGNTLLGN